MGDESLNQRLAQLSPTKRALLELRLKERDLSLAAEPSIPRRDARNSARLSFAQERLWFLNQLDTDNPAYNESKAFRLSGLLHFAALGSALNQIVERHEVLRTNFVLVDDTPRQIIRDHRDIELPVTDLSKLPEPMRSAELDRLLLETIRRPFDLSRDLMLRGLLVRLADQEHVLLVVTHHIASDGWSSSVFWRELSLLYQALSTGQPCKLPELSFQYADFAEWQRTRLQGEVLETHLSYWKKQLDGITTLRLPAAKPRPAVSAGQGSSVNILLEREIVEALDALSRRNGVTLFMTLLAAFQTLLHRYTGQDDIATGSPIAGRNSSDLENSIGFFINTLVLRTDFSRNPCFRELLARIRERALEAYAHQELPFEKLVEELNPERDLNSSPLFQVMFSLQNMPTHRLELSDLIVTPLEISGGLAKFDLYLSFRSDTGGLRGRLDYRTDLFEASFVARMMEHFETLLNGVLTNPEQGISELPIVADIERNRLVIEWDNTQRDYPRDACIHELFETQADRTPEAIAVAFGKQQLTYRELNRRANQLAHHLIRLGVNPGAFIGVCMERSSDMIVATLAILKTGAAYLPLDPEYPKERLAFMIDDAKMSVLITEQRFQHRLPETSVAVVCLDAHAPLIETEPAQSPEIKVGATNSVYVIYTSGSTGKPKGVVVPHRAVIRLVVNTDYVKLLPSDVVAQASSFSFDASTFEIWGALLHGARLEVLPKDIALSPQALSAEIDRCRITVLFLTTALFNQWVDIIPAAFKDLNYLLFGGETADPQRIRKFLRQRPPKNLLHVYGPTESTTFATCYHVNEIDDSAVTVPIGRPVANSAIYLLDRNLQPVPVGVTGEIYIGGDGLAATYLNRPELTAERFIPNLFSDDPDARLYKTGDLARYLQDGNIEFVGRVDDQVKIRGYRIEPGEVEAALNSYPAVRQSFVLAREDGQGDRRLVAYVVAKPQCPVSIHELRAFLKQKLPDFMVPSAMLFLDALPLSANGKVNRKALPFPDLGTPQLSTILATPSTPTEESLSKLWADVLNVKNVNIHDNFFDLGGHSLLGIGLMSRLRAHFQIELPLRYLFEAPTVAELAARIDANRGGTASQTALARKSWHYLFELKTGNSKRPVYFFPGGIGGDYEFLVYARLAHHVGPDYSFYGLRARSADGTNPAHQSVELMAADYLKEIRAFQPEGPYYLVGNCIGGVVAYEIARQLQVRGEKIALLVLMDTYRPTLIKYFRYRAETALHRGNLLLQLFFESYYIQRFVIHRQMFSQLGWPNKLSYLAARVGTLMRDVPRLLPQMEAADLWHGLPVENRVEQIQESYIDTLRRYRAKPYDGSLSLIVNEKYYQRDPTMGWSALVSGKIDVYKARGDHEAYIRDYAEAAAEQLRDCLEKAISRV